MLSESQMVRIKRAIESLYIGRCNIIEHQKVQKENKSTGFEDVTVLEDIPCRLSYQTINTTKAEDNTASSLKQVTKLFIAPNLTVKPGSKISVTQNNVTTEYKSSGQPAIYSTHQEIILEIFKDWA